MGAFQRDSRRRQFSFARLPPAPIAQPSRALVPGKDLGSARGRGFGPRTLAFRVGVGVWVPFFSAV